MTLTSFFFIRWAVRHKRHRLFPETLVASDCSFASTFHSSTQIGIQHITRAIITESSL